MTVAAPPDPAKIRAPVSAQPVPAAGRRAAGRRAAVVLHGLAALVLALGVLVQLVRPLAPDLGPAPPAGSAFDAAFLARAQAYRGPLYVAAAAALCIRIAVFATVALSSAGRAVVDRVVRRVGPQRPARAAAVIITGTVIAADLLIAPLSFWAGYLHDGRFGLRTQGLGGWAYDWAVLHVPVWLGVAVLALVGYWVAGRWPARWPPVAGLAAGLAAAAVTFASPLVLEPLVNDFTPLAAGPVRDEVTAVLDRAGEEVDAILVADASRRSTRENAYISGFGASERVVLYDTLLAQRTPQEVGLVLAHEVAHKRNADVLRFVALAAAGTLVVAYAVDALTRRRTRAGLQSSPADPRGASMVALTLVVLIIASIPVQSFVSRRAEAAADLGSLELTDAPDVFAAMQRGLTTANLAEPQPPPAVTWWWGSHPPAMARLAMARWWEQQ